jgi:hypothetical protein
MKAAMASRQIVSIEKRCIVIPPVFSVFVQSFFASFPQENNADVLVHRFFERFSAGEAGS